MLLRTLKKYSPLSRPFLGTVIASLLLTFFYYMSHSFKKDISTIPSSIIDVIPQGFVMIPIQLENHNSILNLIDSHGIVDLYRKISPSLTHKIATGVKLIRSSTQHFSVLIPEDQATPFVKATQHFYAVVQSLQKKDSKVYPIPERRNRSIVIQGVDFVEEEYL